MPENVMSNHRSSRLSMVVGTALLVAVGCSTEPTGTNSGTDDAGAADAEQNGTGATDAGDDSGDGDTDAEDDNDGSVDGGEPDCEEACGRIYGECELFLLYADADKVPEEGCVQACRDGYFPDGPSCLMDVECDEEKLNDRCVAVDVQEADIGDVDPAGEWPDGWADIERQVFALINLHRDRGWECGGQDFDPAPRLAYDEAVAEAARGHSLDMVREEFYGHDGSDGSRASQRMQQAGYDGVAFGEIINRHYSTPFGAVQTWLESDSHCARMMKPEYTEVGVGFVPDGDSEYGHRWTADFGASGS